MRNRVLIFQWALSVQLKTIKTLHIEHDEIQIGKKGIEEIHKYNLGIKYAKFIYLNINMNRWIKIAFQKVFTIVNFLHRLLNDSEDNVGILGDGVFHMRDPQ